jgi:hypothetical protein
MQSYLDPDTVAHKLTDLSRYRLITRRIMSETVHFGTRTVGVPALLGLYLICGGLKIKSIRDVQSGTAVLAMVLAGYFVVYLTTPLKLDFHLETSLLRLLLQLWPSAVFLFCVGTSEAGSPLYRSLPRAFQPTYRTAGFDTSSQEENCVRHESGPGETV